MHAIWIILIEQYLVIYYLHSINIKVQYVVFDFQIILPTFYWICNIISIYFLNLLYFILFFMHNCLLTNYVLTKQYNCNSLCLTVICLCIVIHFIYFIANAWLFQIKWRRPKNYLMKQVIKFYLFYIKGMYMFVYLLLFKIYF